MNKIIGCFVFFFSLASVSSASGNEMVGVWYGEFREVWSSIQDKPVLRLNISERNSDGSFNVTFYFCKESGLQWIQSEYGGWSYSNGLYRTQVDYIEDEYGKHKANLEESYEVLELDNENVVYRTLRTGNVFRNRRVHKAYEPLCQDLLV